jgi:H+/Cl- antiporter ClcA
VAQHEGVGQLTDRGWRSGGEAPHGEQQLVLRRRDAGAAGLEKQSRVPARVLIAKPLASAVAIGTGGPFGAEGPIIVTGGSLLGQFIPVSPAERKILLASGAAAGMAATFGAPLTAVILALELLLFQFSMVVLSPSTW